MAPNDPNSDNGSGPDTGDSSAGHSGNRDKNYYVQGALFVAPQLAPGLYVVATPIGNLRDITLRGLETLAAADLILCEDTRLSARLLDHFGIKSRRASLHDHNERGRIDSILKALAEGQVVALISDAGTPLLSDPGFPLVRAVAGAGYEIIPLPGASALLASLVISGLPTDRFAFFGFLPNKVKARETALDDLKSRPETLVFYESPRRLGACLSAMAKMFGAEREAVVALELTKRFERVARAPLGELRDRFSADAVKGEAVILVAGAPETVLDPDLWQAALVTALKDQPLRMAVDEITAQFKLKRKQVYDAALALKQNNS